MPSHRTVGLCSDCPFMTLTRHPNSKIRLPPGTSNTCLTFQTCGDDGFTLFGDNTCEMFQLHAVSWDCYPLTCASLAVGARSGRVCSCPHVPSKGKKDTFHTFPRSSRDLFLNDFWKTSPNSIFQYLSVWGNECHTLVSHWFCIRLLIMLTGCSLVKISSEPQRELWWAQDFVQSSRKFSGK